ncbi:putative TetR-family transcriptional regulator [Actinoplanes missouriensis 431]|uniref:Putative TetR-family transcriptional regulator n=1 Tax=Actinoplanes missouriensis (strain ATCC 14538 / DSM 43046 / CBS 188.64 / JCM 3121 / NBRC 102363 / NCIMB 12654 / NRRL B-3342 / UNCC 431) TaxID=512565 RepID=I0HEI0_ACTM4|nr:TetR/AcrR family transcriptional regulator [Actinoplanes missouriensis]BAL91417.1 putative TetR-family transcriptional regulator [Actinoplanes missouriensis 431]
MDPELGLRDRLVRVGVELVRTDGSTALSLREIARRAGVSHGAPRRHFPTHRELLSAIAREGFRDLTARVTATLAGAPPGPRARVALLARDYARFAAEERGMFELMFRHDLLESGSLGLRDTSLPLFRLLVALVAEAQPDGAGSAQVRAGALWAGLHGVVQLWSWGSLALATGLEDPAPLLDATVAAHLGSGR